ncbi:MAG: radical SAM protein [Promethearchaeota archaeon]
MSKSSLVRKGAKRLTHIQFMDLFKKLRLRFTLTPRCNLWCLFCSNEGSSYSTKSQNHADIDMVIKLSEMILKNTSLKMIDFSGGEPTIHPDFKNRKFKLIKWTKKYPHIRFSLHSNGIDLDPEVIDEIKNNFSRIGISIHSPNFKTWNKMTNLHNMFQERIQKDKFKKLLKNIQYLANQDIGYKVFLKSVIMRGFNDSEKEIKAFLDLCHKYHFHPKFLQFDPQFPNQHKYVVGRKELFEKLEKIGCKFTSDVPRHNDPNTYIPGVNFTYKNAPCGLHSIFGCGLKAACESCYDFICIFVKPTENGKGLYLKPCSVLDTRIDLSNAIKKENHEQLLNLFKLSREYLMSAPGLGMSNWNKDAYFE